MMGDISSLLPEGKRLLFKERCPAFGIFQVLYVYAVINNSEGGGMGQFVISRRSNSSKSDYKRSEQAVLGNRVQ